MSDTLATVPASEVIRAGACAAACMLALDDESCECRCGGLFHGALKDAPIEGDYDDIARSLMTLRCAVCHRSINRDPAYIVGPGKCIAARVICVAHMNASRELHARFHPTCRVTFHDLWDHPVLFGTPAALFAAISNSHQIDDWGEVEAVR